jgi:hypothetical protein
VEDGRRDIGDGRRDMGDGLAVGGWRLAVGGWRLGLWVRVQVERGEDSRMEGGWPLLAGGVW